MGKGIGEVGPKEGVEDREQGDGGRIQLRIRRVISRTRMAAMIPRTRSQAPDTPGFVMIRS